MELRELDRSVSGFSREPDGITSKACPGYRQNALFKEAGATLRLTVATSPRPAPIVSSGLP